MSTEPRAAPSIPLASEARVLPALSEVEERILEFMVLYLRRNTYQPTVRDIAHQFGIRSTKTVTEHLKSLTTKGYLERDPARSRGIRILGLDLNARTVALPRFATLEEAVSTPVRDAHPETHLSLDSRLVARKGGFLVRAPGDRLAAAGVRPVDTLIVQPVRADQLADGEIVVARTGDATDYGQFRRMGSRALVYPIGGGPNRAPAEENDQPVIVGRVAGLFRRMGAQPMTVPLTPH